MLVSYKRLIDEGWSMDFASAMRLEAEVAQAWNSGLTPEALEARRTAVIARGRAQSGA